MAACCQLRYLLSGSFAVVLIFLLFETIGAQSNTQQDLEDALKNTKNEVLKLERKNADHKTLLKARDSLAMLYLMNKNLSESMRIYEENIDLANESGSNDLLPKCYWGMASIYSDMLDRQNEEKYLLKCLEISEEKGNSEFQIKSLYRLGYLILKYDENAAEARRYFIRTLQTCEKYNYNSDTGGMVDALINTGWCCYLLKEYDSALYYFSSSLIYSKPAGFTIALANANGNIGNVYRDRDQYDLARKYYQTSILYAREANDFYTLSWVYKDLSDLDKLEGNFTEAYQYHVLYKQYDDSLNNRLYKQNALEMRTRFETDVKEKELELLAVKINQQRYFIYGFIGLCVLLVIIGFLIFHQISTNHKRHIAELNHELSEIAHANLRHQMNPHFIFNTLNSIQYYMYQHDKYATNKYLTKFSGLIRKVLENSRYTTVAIQDEMEAVKLYLDLETFRFKNKFTYDIQIDEEIDPLTHQIPAMLIQPFVENAICHGLIHKKDPGKVRVELKWENDHILCIVEDDGIGREAAHKIRKEERNKNEALGIKITESRLNFFSMQTGKNLKIYYDDLTTSDGGASGTRVKIEIPVIT